MINHYEILGLTENANLDEIKSAYKRLAKQYHPDLNTSLEAEEKFIIIALAYNTLSNPVSRSKFDSMLTQQRLAKAQAYAKAKRPYPAYQYNRQAQSSYKKASPADIKRERLGTLYAVGLIVSVALAIYILSSLVNFYQNQKKEKLITSADAFHTKAEVFFMNGDQQAALITIDSLKNFVSNNTSIERYVANKISQKKNESSSAFHDKQYFKSIGGMLFYMQYTGIQDQQMLYNLAIAYRYTQDFDKATFILNKLLDNNYRRIYTIALMADIYHHDLNNSAVAITYYKMALTNIEANFIASYGKAYRLFVSKEKTPFIYKKIYHDAAALYFELEQYKKARRLLEWVVFFEPERAEGYELLVKTYQQLKQINSACNVIKKAKKHDISLSNFNALCNA